MTPLLKRLEAQGYVERVRGVEDERQVHIRLTNAGSALKQSARSIPDEIYCASGSDIDAMLRLRGDLVRLRASLTEYLDN
jgi:DNA-binding MarR family transcriptional regulator